MRGLFRLFLICVFSSVILSCGGGGGGGGEENPAPTSLDLNIGVLLDSAVEGVSFNTETQTGTTNSQGEFSYKNGETITFSIGALDFPQVTAIQMITPLTLAGVVSLTDQTATNIARLLQSLDEDGDPQNGIKILSNAALVATQMEFNVDVSTFETNPNVINLVANSGSINTTLVSASEAQVHLGGTLNDAGIDTDTTTTGVGAGSVTLSGPGSTKLTRSPYPFIPTKFRSLGLGPTGAEILTWANDEITINVVTIGNNVISQISIKTKTPGSVYQWQILLLIDPINSTYDGSKVVFNGDTLSELNLRAGDITINGSLTTDTNTGGNGGTIEPNNPAQISGIWSSSCVPIGPLSIKFIKTFSAATGMFSDSNNSYSDSNCQSLTETNVVGGGTYKVGNSVTTTLGHQGYELDTTIDLLAGITFYGSFVLDGTSLYFSDHSGVDLSGGDILVPGTPEDRILKIDFTKAWQKQ